MLIVDVVAVAVAAVVVAVVVAVVQVITLEAKRDSCRSSNGDGSKISI